MPATVLQPFPADALDANRRGELSESQRRGFGALSGHNRRSALSGAAFLVAGAVLIVFFASPTSSATLRTVLPLVALAIAAFLVVRSVTGSDALTRDVRQGRVESVEGAIGRRRLGNGGNVTTYLLDVGERSFRVRRATYQAAPEAGMVRLYFLPASRKVVNLERLGNPPAPADLTPQGVVGLLGATVGSQTGSEANEARARIAGLRDAFDAAFAPASAGPPAGARDSRRLAEAIVGTWTNGFLTVTFSSDGAITTHMLHGEMRGRWSVDDRGHLHADIAGREQAAEAWIAGNQLTIAIEGSGLTFTRRNGA